MPDGGPTQAEALAARLEDRPVHRLRRGFNCPRAWPDRGSCSRQGRRLPELMIMRSRPPFASALRREGPN